MPKIDSSFKEEIKKLDKKTLEQVLIKLAAKDKQILDFITLNYLDLEGTEKDLFEEAKADLDSIFYKRYKGFSEELRLANMMSAAIKRINDFVKLVKNRNMEAQLLMKVLGVPFSMPSSMFGTCFTQFDSKTGAVLKRLINLVSNKLEEDYQLDYIPQINAYLKRLKTTSRHIDAIYALPDSI